MPTRLKNPIASVRNEPSSCSFSAGNEIPITNLPTGYKIIKSSTNAAHCQTRLQLTREGRSGRHVWDVIALAIKTGPPTLSIQVTSSGDVFAYENENRMKKSLLLSSMNDSSARAIMHRPSLRKR
jgi:hypothetical protein